jgi:hypothetical protein
LPDVVTMPIARPRDFEGLKLLLPCQDLPDGDHRGDRRSPEDPR